MSTLEFCYEAIRALLAVKVKGSKMGQILSLLHQGSVARKIKRMSC